MQHYEVGPSVNLPDCSASGRSVLLMGVLCSSIRWAAHTLPDFQGAICASSE